MSEKKILVTGAGGFIGGYVVEEFLSKGSAIRATDLPCPDTKSIRELGVEFIASDLLDILIFL